ncbi:MAG: acetyltransferase [Candidatus Electrothrix sp. AR1]|nr:acetyltransferase [Candidatus Electrothrix sp. AR1]
MISHPEAEILAVPGRPETYTRRKEIIDSLNLEVKRFATIVHPDVKIGIECSIGRNVLIMAYVVLTSNVTLGDHIVLLPPSIVSHGTVINDYTLVGSNVSISGNVIVGSNSYIGTGAKIIQEITIGEQALVGLGSVVIKTVRPRTTVAGNPAEELKKR